MAARRQDELDSTNAHSIGSRQLSAPSHSQTHALQHPAPSSASWQDSSMIGPPVSFFDPSDTLDHDQQPPVIWQQWEQVAEYAGSGTNTPSYHQSFPSAYDASSNQHHAQPASADMPYRFPGQNSTYQNLYQTYPQQPPSGAAQAAQRFEEYYRRSDPLHNAPIQSIQQSRQHVTHIVPPRAPTMPQVQQQQQRQLASMPHSQRSDPQTQLNVPAPSFTFQPSQISAQSNEAPYYPPSNPLQTTQRHTNTNAALYWSQQAARTTSTSPGAPSSFHGSTTPSGSSNNNNNNTTATHSPSSSGYPSTNTPSSTTTATTDTASSSSRAASASAVPRQSFAMTHVSHSSADTVRSGPPATTGGAAGRYAHAAGRPRVAGSAGQQHRARRIVPTIMGNEHARAGVGGSVGNSAGAGAPKRAKAPSGNGNGNGAGGGGSGGRTNKRRRETKPALDNGVEGSDASEEEDEEDEDGREGKKGTDVKRLGACSHCKQLKMRCNFPPGDSKCERCANTGHECFIPQRKTKQNPAKREYLLAQIRQKDQVIDTLLKQLHNPYIATPLSISSFKLAASPSDENKENVLEWFNRLHGSVHGSTHPQAPDIRAYAPEPGLADATSDSGEGEEGDDVESASDGVPSVLPDDAVPIGLLAKLSLDRQKKRTATEVDEDEDVGVANAEYFRPGPATNLSARKHLIEQNALPDIVVHGLVTPEDVDKLFAIYYEKLNPFIHLLDPVLHTPKAIFHRCPFLYTVICAVASRYSPEKSEIYPIAMHFAKHSAATALIDGWKTVELCQAYILMSIYGVPARRWEEDRSWLYTGLAIRIATDLNLHKLPTTQPQSDRQIREMLNRTRVWLICHNIDRSTATQFGKPLTVKEDYIVKNSVEWYKGREQNHPWDVYLCAYVALMRILTRFIDEVYSDPNTPSGLNKSIDYHSLALRYDEKLNEYYREWDQRFTEIIDPNDTGGKFRVTLLPFMTSYSKLVVFSFGFQQAFERGMQAADDIFFKKCFEAAKFVIVHMINVMAPSGYIRYAPDGHFIFASFASAFLLKLLRPEFLHLLTPDMESEIFDVIHQLIDVFDSDQVAIDERHTPKLYARFLTALLSKHRKGGAAMVANRQQHFPPGGQTLSSSPPSAQGMTDPSLASGARSTPSSDQGHSGAQEPQAMQMNVGSSATTQASGAAQATQYSTPGEMHPAAAPLHDGNMGVQEDAVMFNVNELSQLAPMRAITANLDNFWNNMMLPGFTWTDGPVSQDSQGRGYSSYPGFQSAFSEPAFSLVGASL